MKKVISAMILLVMVLLTRPLQAQIYYFTQDGFQGGGSISGSFTGEDSNGDGFLKLTWNNKTEISDFTASFSGNTTSPNVAAFDLIYTDLWGLQYKLTDGNIVDDIDNGMNGGNSNNFQFAAYNTSSNVNYNYGSYSNSVNPLVLSTSAPTPEPGTWALMGIGGLLAAFRLRKSAIASALSV